MRVTRTYQREYAIEATVAVPPPAATAAVDAAPIEIVTGPTCVSPVGCETVCVYWRDGRGWSNRPYGFLTPADRFAVGLLFPQCETLDDEELEELAAERAAYMEDSG